MYRLPILVAWAGWGCLLAGCSAPVASVPDEPERAWKPKVVARARSGPAEGPKAKEEAAPPFRLPADGGGALLAKVLPPSAGGPAVRIPGRRPRRPPPPPGFDPPPEPLPPAELPAPRLPRPGEGRVLRPHLVLEEELGAAPGAPDVPRRPVLAAGERLRVPSVDVGVPPPLPPLASPVPDRASLEDATAEVSAGAVRSARMPERGTPAPYGRLGVPDPYEHRRPLTLPVPAEGATPQAGSPLAGRP